MKKVRFFVAIAVIASLVIGALPTMGLSSITAADEEYNNDNVLGVDEIDPQKQIKDIQPKNGESHFEQEKGLSWTAADGAVGHRVYLGDDMSLVSVADKDCDQFCGEIKKTFFDLSFLKFDPMKTYYWRIDEVFEDGSVVTGKVNSFKIARLAFPTAEGYGRYANGGRGGQILEVTTLEDGYVTVVDEEGNPVLNEFGLEVKAPIEGSLRWAVESVTGPRIVVFKVGGVINLEDMITIDSNHGDIYIAGQTATGDGITLNNYGIRAKNASDIIIRNIRIRTGDYSHQSIPGMDFDGCDNCIIDHCSISWATDANFSSRNSSNITLQKSIIAEALGYTSHNAVGKSEAYEDVDDNIHRAHAASVGGNIGSYHHNLLINNSDQNWLVNGGLAFDEKTYGGYVDITNNVVYNWQNGTTEGGARRVQFVGNYYKMGAASSDMDIFTIDGNALGLKDDWQMAYLSGNKMVDVENNVLLDPDLDDPWKKASVLNSGNNMEDASVAISYETFFDSYITEQNADKAYESVLADVGAVVPALDYLDLRYIKEVTEGSYTYTGSKFGLPGIIDSQDDAGGYPNETNFKGGEAPLDTDHDGMPDEWEHLHDLDPTDPSDNNEVTLSKEGYTNIEMYLNELMGDPLEWVENGTICPTPYVSPTPNTSTPQPELLGDVNDDDAVNATDALAVLRHSAKLELLDDEVLTRADVTEDGSIDAKDALAILKIAAKI